MSNATIVEEVTLNWTDLTGAKTGATALGSNKFYRAQLFDDFSVLFTYGRVGQSGQTQTVQGRDLADAKKQLAKKIDSKIAKGYTKVELHTDADEQKKASKAGAGKGYEQFDIAPSVPVAIGPDVDACRAMVKPFLALYMGGMGAKEQNFHKQVFERMGYADLADRVQELYLAGRKDEATALVPDELVDDMHIIGTAGEVRERVAQWEETGVTTLLLSCRTPEEIRGVAQVLA